MDELLQATPYLGGGAGLLGLAVAVLRWYSQDRAQYSADAARADDRVDTAHANQIVVLEARIAALEADLAAERARAADRERELLDLIREIRGTP